MTTQGLRRERWSKNKPLLVSKDSSRINGTWTYEFPTVQVSNDRSYWNNACLPFVDLWFTSAICTWCVILPWTPAINLSTIPSINRWADLSFSWLCSVCFCMKSWQLCSKQRMSILTVESCSFLFRMGSGFLREPNSWSTVCKEIYTPHTIGYFFLKGHLKLHGSPTSSHNLLSSEKKKSFRNLQSGTINFNSWCKCSNFIAC